MVKPRVGTVGSSNMARALGVRLARAGHEVCFGGRTSAAPERAASLARPYASSGTISEAVRFGEVLLWTANEQDPAKVVVDVAALDNKVMVDLNNRDYANEVVGEDSRWFDRSLGEMLQADLPRSKIVEAFNTVAMEILDTSAELLRQGGAQIFVAGVDDAAYRTVVELAEQLGFAALDLGAAPAEMRVAEALGDAVRYIMIDGHRGGRANIAINMLPKPDTGVIGDRASSAYH